MKRGTGYQSKRYAPEQNAIDARPFYADRALQTTALNRSDLMVSVGQYPCGIRPECCQVGQELFLRDASASSADGPVLDSMLGSSLLLLN